jgi:cobalt-zinc-cadmium efflux system membrane fusion protein
MSRPLRICLATLLLVPAACSRNPQEAKTAPEVTAPSSDALQEVVLAPAEQQRASLQVETVQLRSVPQVLSATGRIALNENRSWRVGAVTDGRIVSVLANPGDRVKAGQVLARMHSHEIHESRAAYQKALGELSRLRTVAAHALRMRDRTRRLYELKFASQEQLEQAETELKSAQTAVHNAETELERTRLHLTEFLGIPVESRPGESHEEDADLIPIRSPAEGIVLARNVTPGTVVQPSTETFVVSDLSSLWMIAAVSEEYLPRLREGMPAQVYVRAYPNRAFPGRIIQLAEGLDPTTRTVQIRILLSNPGGWLKPEMFASAEIQLPDNKQAIFVPEGAPQEVNRHMVVFVRKAADRFEVRPVELGRVVEGHVEVTAGLRAGEAVVTRGSFVLKSQLFKATLAEE